MIFVGQINCADLRGMPGAEFLPTSGLLAFFAEYDGVMACRIEARDAAVYHWTGIKHLVPAVAPIEPALILPPCAFVTRPLIDLPHPDSVAVKDLGLNTEQSPRYAAVWKAVRGHGIPDELEHYCSFGKLLGWPALVQWNDLDVFQAYEGSRLLLQVDEYCSGETERIGFGPGGSLYFTLPEQDLRESDFERCEFEIQFT